MEQGYQSKRPSAAQDSSLEALEAANAMEGLQKYSTKAVFKLMVEANCANLIKNTFKGREI
jgi:hypothetical protein